MQMKLACIQPCFFEYRDNLKQKGIAEVSRTLYCNQRLRFLKCLHMAVNSFCFSKLLWFIHFGNPAPFSSTIILPAPVKEAMPSEIIPRFSTAFIHFVSPHMQLFV